MASTTDDIPDISGRTLTNDETSEPNSTTSTTPIVSDSFEDEVIGMMRAIVKSQLTTDEFDTFQSVIGDKQLDTVRRIANSANAYTQTNDFNVLGLFDHIKNTNPEIGNIGDKYGTLIQSMQDMSDKKISLSDYIKNVASTFEISDSDLIKSSLNVAKAMNEYYDGKGIEVDLEKQFKDLMKLDEGNEEKDDSTAETQ